MAALTQSELSNWATQATKLTQTGRLPNYVPLLSLVNPHQLAVYIQLHSGQSFSVGSIDQPFTLMSVIKPFLLLFLLHQLGSEAVFARVGMQPSDQPFHALNQLVVDRGFPRNPMINSGAIALAALLPGSTSTARCETLRQWLNHHSGSQLVLDFSMLASVRSLNNEANRAIAHHLAKAGHLDSVDVALDTYNQICCLSCTVTDLARLGLLLSQPQMHVSSVYQRTVNALMLTCGLYEASGPFAVQVGLPTKSGVSGAVLSIIPGEGAIACYSPMLDQAGNSIAGLSILERLSHSLNLSIFRVAK